MKNTKIIWIFFFLLFLSCGFKPIGKIDRNQIFIQDVNFQGEKRIGYTLKNNILLISNKSSASKYLAEIKVVKQKKIKIKDTTGKAKRYTIFLNTSLELVNLTNDIKTGKTFIRNVDFDVSKDHSSTLNNERNAINNLIQKISEDMINFISFSGLN